jgi:uncharacterized membrane protein (Fun14 family)
MNAESLFPIATSIGGGFFYRILLGYLVKKIIKMLMFITGGIVDFLLYLQQHQIISVNMEKLEGCSTYILTSITSSFDKMSQVGDVTTLGIPFTASITTAGFTVVFMKG